MSFADAVQLGRELPGSGTVRHARGLQGEGVLGELIELAHGAQSRGRSTSRTRSLRWKVCSSRCRATPSGHATLSAHSMNQVANALSSAHSVGPFTHHDSVAVPNRLPAINVVV
jgi:hypothetical protein